MKQALADEMSLKPNLMMALENVFNIFLYLLELYEIQNVIKEIDHNGNGVIEPAEFDHDLK